ncbi:amphoterin-induced protein 3 [Gadus morhua]|uniref:Ig-like domain-containing protein n=1 Tax=Gadus morhua TaxID=8049 RepID=A0A8C5CTW9_GADMO|nr:amphoterin-induced protein 3 [Gadus morhua]
MFCVGGSDGSGGRESVSAPPRPPRPRLSCVLLSVCVLLGQLSPALGAVCPPGCICGSDILSCTAMGEGLEEVVPAGMPPRTVMMDLSHNRIARLEPGSFSGLARLETLRLNHNQMAEIQPGAFLNASGAALRHLDLSSNHLRVLEAHYFTELSGLEELLLFNNRIARVENHALAGLGRLRKAYLSHNRLTDFPFFSIREDSHPELTMLDLSSNRLLKLPIDDIVNLPLAVQRGLYLHNNSLLCDCSMYGLFRHWEERGYDTVKFFRHEHICLVYGIQRGTVRFFQHARYFENCSATGDLHMPDPQESDVVAYADHRVALHCVTGLRGRHVSFIWVTPNQEYVAPPGNNGSLRMFHNGTLVIAAVKHADGGVYWCMARDRSGRRNETSEVNVTVAVPLEGDVLEGFNTGFTTLLGCVVSLVLVLMYLYLTPCRCPPWRKVTAPPAVVTAPAPAPGAGNDPAAGGGQSSILTPTPPATTEGPGRKVSTNKHVVFMEPIKEQQNGRLRLGPGAMVGHGGHLGPGLLLGAGHPAAKPPGQSQQRAGETDSIVSVFSDTPIMSP